MNTEANSNGLAAAPKNIRPFRATEVDLPKLNLDPLFEYLKKQGRVPDYYGSEQLERIGHTYKEFWRRCRRRPEALVRPEGDHVVDLWHAHVLHTKQYARDCQEYFGYFLHHLPTEEATHGSR